MLQYALSLHRMAIPVGSISPKTLRPSLNAPALPYRKAVQPHTMLDPYDTRTISTTVATGLYPKLLEPLNQSSRWYGIVHRSSTWCRI